MKRSEAIKVITDVLVLFKTQKCEFLKGNEDESKAIMLLTALEEIGMQPRPYKAKALIGFYEVQDWEPEE